MITKKIDLRIPLIFIWPFGAFLLSLRSLNSRFSGFVYVFFSTLLGYSFSFSETSADSFRVAWVFANFDYTNIGYIYNRYLSGGYPDIYKYLSYGFIQQFTNNPKFLFALFGFVFGYFSYKAIIFFLKDIKDTSGWYVLILVSIFFFLNSLLNINGARFATAAIIAICALIGMFHYNKKIWIIPLISTVLFHFSFLLFVPIILLLFFGKNKFISNEKIQKWIFWFYIIAFALSFLHSTNIFNLEVIAQFLPRSIARKIELYNSDELTATIEERNTTVFHTVKNFFSALVRCYYLIIIIYISKSLKKLRTIKATNLQWLFNLALLLLAITYILFIFPSGGRFATISTQFFLFFLIRYYFFDKSKIIKRLILGFIPMYAFFVSFNIGFLAYNLISPTLWFGNLFWIIADGWNYVFNGVL